MLCEPIMSSLAILYLDNYFRLAGKSSKHKVVPVVIQLVLVRKQCNVYDSLHNGKPYIDE